MALQLGALRDALIDAGAAPDKASQAAEEAAGYEEPSGGDRDAADGPDVDGGERYRACCGPRWPGGVVAASGCRQNRGALGGGEVMSRSVFVIGAVAGIWFVAAFSVSLLDRIAVGMTGEYDPLAPFFPNIVIAATIITIGVVWLLSRKDAV